jgi:hypothetical protein
LRVVFLIRYRGVMPEFTIKWPNGAEVTYNGDVSFEELQAFLESSEPPASLRGPGTAHRKPSSDHSDSEDPEADELTLDPHAVAESFERVNARTDIERVTVLAYLSREAGAPGVDIETAQSMYRELGLRMPGTWRSTFSNARTRGYIVNEGRGFFRPTAAGENFARLAQRRPSAAARRRRRGNQASLLGGEDDA